MEEEIVIRYMKNLINVTEKNNKNTPAEMEANIEISVEIAKSIINLIENQNQVMDLMGESISSFDKQFGANIFKTGKDAKKHFIDRAESIRRTKEMWGE